MRRIFAQGRDDRVRDFFHLLIGRPLPHIEQDLIADLFKRLDMRLLMLLHLYDVEPILGLHQIADLTRLQAEGGFFELRHGLPFYEVTQFAPLAGRTRIVGILFRQFGEIAAPFELLQQGGRFRLDEGFGGAFGLEKNVARLHPLPDLEVVLAAGVIGQYLRVGNIDAARDSLRINQDERHVAFVGDLERYLMGIVISLHFGVGGFCLSLKFGRRHYHVLQLHLVIALVEFRFNLRWRYHGSAGDHLLQPVHPQLPHHVVFQLAEAYALLLQQARQHGRIDLSVLH